MSFYKVTLKRSLIGLPKSTRINAASLGFSGKTGRTIFRKVNATNAGQILKLKELVQVKLVDEPKTKEQMRMERKSDPGFTVEKKFASQGSL